MLIPGSHQNRFAIDSAPSCFRATGAGRCRDELIHIPEGFVERPSGMKSVEVDAAKKTARVAPGATLGDIDAATQAHGLALLHKPVTDQSLRRAIAAAVRKGVP